MREIYLSQDIVPIGEFKSQAAHWLNHIRKTRHPLVITQNGKPAGVLLSPVEYDALQQRERFFDSIEQGLRDADQGQTMTTAQLKKKLVASRLPEEDLQEESNMQRRT